ncbi:MAG TPA: hypothetical protein VF719_04160 [Abditibacteriaceae bacterium]|jgi:hypothetical protein
MKKRSGFAIIELPVVVLTLGIALLLLTLLIYRTSGKFAWFLVVVGGLFAALGITLLAIIFLPGRRK